MKMLPLEPWIVNQDGSMQQKYKEVAATIVPTDGTIASQEWISMRTTSIGPVSFSLRNSFSSLADAKTWCNANVILAYGIKENTDKAFEAYQLAMVQYNIDLVKYHKDMEVYSNKMGVWIQQNKEWLSSKYPAPSRPGPHQPKPTTPAVDPGPMPVQPSPPIRPIDPRDMSPVRPPARPRPPRPGGLRSL
jgi:hypothetical protein